VYLRPILVDHHDDWNEQRPCPRRSLSFRRNSGDLRRTPGRFPTRPGKNPEVPFWSQPSTDEDSRIVDV
jgi:hypothetical protein